MRLIDADKVIELIEDEIIDCDDDTVLANGCRAGLAYARSIVATRPTIGHVKHGRWVGGKGETECSACGELALFDEDCQYITPYCPFCGARMNLDTTSE